MDPNMLDYNKDLKKAQPEYLLENRDFINSLCDRLNIFDPLDRPIRGTEIDNQAIESKKLKELIKNSKGINGQDLSVPMPHNVSNYLN